MGQTKIQLSVDKCKKIPLYTLFRASSFRGLTTIGSQGVYQSEYVQPFTGSKALITMWAGHRSRGLVNLMVVSDEQRYNEKT